MRQEIFRRATQRVDITAIIYEMKKQFQIQNVNELYENQLSFGDRAADWVASKIGSWTFILIQSTLLLAWVILNTIAWLNHWDEYPFILMNLILSMQAAMTAPIIMMSQNRQAFKDRIEAHQDFLIDQKTEQKVEVLLAQLQAQQIILIQLQQTILSLEKQLQEPKSK